MPDVDRPRGWLLTVDGAPQSYVDLDDPECLEFEYVRRIAYALEAGSAPGEPVAAVHLGGGGMTVPRWLAWARPGSRQDVVEADRRLAALVAEHLPLADPASVTVHTADARAWLATAAEASADAVVADVFGGARVPAHLTSVEFVRAAHRVLRPGGVYVANVADAAPFAFLRSQLATVRAVFPAPAEICLLAEPGVLRGRRFGNAVLVASAAPLPVDALARLCAADAFPARVVHGAALDRFTGRARPVYDTSAAPSPTPPDGAFTVG
ncbi:spermidine synthase [Streptomyces sp. NPDC093221]|uniref:spermidine synthase n=1 Tax=Streptomyces sp. NPDC093221 TaxID=3366032 RepID=UPI0037FA8E75